MHEMQVTDVTLFSFHSMSKGYYGECGHRSGYLEVRNVPDDVFAQFVKLQSINLCQSGWTNCMLLMVSPPGRVMLVMTYILKKTFILNDLKEKAQIIGSEG